MLKIKFDGERPKIIQVETHRLAEFTKWTQEGNDWILALEMALEIRFDRRVEVISIEPDESVRSSDWIQDGDDWVLVILFGSEPHSRFGWTGDQIRIVKED